MGEKSPSSTAKFEKPGVPAGDFDQSDALETHRQLRDKLAKIENRPARRAAIMS